MSLAPLGSLNGSHSFIYSRRFFFDASRFSLDIWLQLAMKSLEPQICCTRLVCTQTVGRQAIFYKIVAKIIIQRGLNIPQKPRECCESCKRLQNFARKTNIVFVLVKQQLECL